MAGTPLSQAIWAPEGKMLKARGAPDIAKLDPASGGGPRGIHGSGEPDGIIDGEFTPLEQVNACEVIT
ncbi:MAG: hypothetical protein EOQ42_30780 [Mesorhizobium sp.]|nr:MAG: hypothetical protein EOQ42_30780 [Mesorhizobium sp.]TIT29163.1 MAG: hypothetical protein E5W78_16070 [Mesorhizobium sp.]